MARSRTIPRLAALLTLALLAGIPAAGARAGGVPTRLRVAPAVSELEVGEVVTLEVRVEQVSNLYGYEVYLDYDPRLLQAVDAAGRPVDQVELGTFFAADLVLQNAVDPAAGRVSVVASNMGSEPASGSGTLFTLRFKVLQRGVATVAIDADDTILADSEGMSIPYTRQDATLYVGVEAPRERLYLPAVLRSR